MSAGSVTIDILANSQPFERDINRLGDRAAKVGGTLTKALTVPIAGIGAAAIAAAIKTGEFADKILDLEEITGFSSDALQRLERVAGFAGVSFDGLVNGVTQFTRRIPQLESGTGDVAAAFGALGVDLRDANDELRSGEDLYFDIIKALQSVENQTERNVIAQQVLGRNLQDLAPVLGLTADEFQRVFDAAQPIPRESLERANEFRQVWSDLKLDLRDAGLELGQAVIPLVQELAPLIRDAASAAADLARYFADLDPAAQKAVAGVGAFLLLLGPAVKTGGVLLKTAAAIKTIAAALGAAGAASAAAGVAVVAVAGVANAKVLDLVSQLADSQELVAEAFGVSENSLRTLNRSLETTPLVARGFDSVVAQLEAVAERSGDSAVALARASIASDEVGESAKILLRQYVAINETLDDIGDRQQSLADLESQALESVEQRREQTRQSAEEKIAQLEAEQEVQQELKVTEVDRLALLNEAADAYELDAITKAQAYAEQLTLQAQQNRNQEEYNRLLAEGAELEQRLDERRKAASDALSKVATPTLQAFGQELANLAIEGELAWGNVGAAAVEGVAAIIRALGQEWAARGVAMLAASLFPPNPLAASASAKWFAASAGAFAAAGVVSAGASKLRAADGMVVNPSSGGQQVVMAEAGVPELALPLRPDTISMFANAIADQMGGGNGETYIRLEIDGRALDAYVTEQIGNRKIRVVT